MNLEWGPAELSEEAKAQIVSLISARDPEAIKENGEPDFRRIQKLGGPVFLRHAIVNSAKDVTDGGRDQGWLFKAVFDDEMVASAGEIGEEAVAYLSRVLFAAFVPTNPSGVGQVFAHEHGYVLCEYRRRGDSTLRFFSRNADVVAKYYLEDTGEDLRKAMVKAHKRTSLALDVIPELETTAARMLVSKMRAGLNELPEAKAEIKAIRSRNGNSDTTQPPPEIFEDALA